MEEHESRGRRQKSTKQQKKKLNDIIENGPIEYGYNTNLWTLKRTADAILRKFGISYKIPHIWRGFRSLVYSTRFHSQPRFKRIPIKSRNCCITVTQNP